MGFKIKILVVDDNTVLLEMLNEALVEKGFDVLCCNDGDAAQKNFSEFKPDIVLTDIVMPGVDGIELLLGLRKINPNIKVIAMSGGNRGHADTYLHMAEKIGANVILVKPFEISDLLEQIKILTA